MKIRRISGIFLVFFFAYLTGCSSAVTVPPEVKLVEEQELNLWRAGAQQYLPERYERYRTDLARAKKNLAKTDSGISLSGILGFDEHKAVNHEFSKLHQQGEELFKMIEVEKKIKTKETAESIDQIQERINAWSNLTLSINDGRHTRSSLAKAGIILREARMLYEKGELIASRQMLNDVEANLLNAGKTIAPVVDRYTNGEQIAKWKKWADETILESEGKGIYSILVIKAERKLSVYKNGQLLKKYDIGLGRNGFSYKLHAGDNATPEGKYRIIRKNPGSRYHKALLIDYPNKNDRKEFEKARKNGLVSKSAGIGGLIEIHGGSKDGMTYGCISLDNRHMEELFSIVDVGTPVTIIGATDHENKVSRAAKGL